MVGPLLRLRDMSGILKYSVEERVARLTLSGPESDFDAQPAQEAARVAECAATNDFRLGVQAVLGRQRAQFA